jgi:hypothetical protein
LIRLSDLPANACFLSGFIGHGELVDATRGYGRTRAEY